MNSNDELKYKDVTDTLRQLQQVNAPAGFEDDLMRRINSANISSKKAVWEKIVIPSRLIPAAALAVTAVLLIFVLNDTGVMQENPLLTAPRERSEITRQGKPDILVKQKKPSLSDESLSSREMSGIRKDEDTQNKPLEKPLDKQKSISLSSEGNIAGNTSGNDQFITAKFAANGINNYPVNKAGLNFRQVNLSNKQKIELNQLKEKLDAEYKVRGKR